MSAGKRKALGRGLSALIPDAAPPGRGEKEPAAGRAGATTATTGIAAPSRTTGAGTNTVTRHSDGMAFVSIESLAPSSLQPRRAFDEGKLNELAESIRTQGVIEPLVVRPRPARGKTGPGGASGTGADKFVGAVYEIIAGERRWRAGQRAGLRELPVIIKDVADTRAFEMALVENLQREDLNPIEEAEGFERLINEFGYKQEMLAARVGKNRSTVANSLRILRLPESVRALVIEGKLSMGHARALLGLESSLAMEQAARQTTARGLSVRAVESLVRKARDASSAGARAKGGPATPSSAVRDLEQRLQRALGTRVKVAESGPGAGHLEIFYHSLDELDRLLDRLIPS